MLSKLKFNIMKAIFKLAIISLLLVSCQKKVSKNYMQGTWYTQESEDSRFFAKQMQLESAVVSIEFSDVKNPKGYNYMHVRIDDKIMSCYYNVEGEDRISLGPNADGHGAMNAIIDRIDNNHFRMTIIGTEYSRTYERE